MCGHAYCGRVAETSVADLRNRLDGLTLRDAARFGRRLKSLRGAKPEKLRQLADQIAAAETLVAARQAAVPRVTYPDLPVSDRRHELADAIRSHQVVVVAGETGSGKTTQLPKICLEMGRGVRGLIGHTQPRRLAARTVAQRIADELGSPLGDAVGYSVRFNDHVSERTLVKLMTDGILLAEIQRDRRLMRYDTLIIDEAHERSLNVDFLLGYLHELLPRRPELKVIITSATIEPQRFAAHFGGAPIIEVSGRAYPVEIRYRPLEMAVSAAARDDPDDPDHEVVRTEIRDEVEAIVDAVAELEAEPPGDVLVFLSGEREIRDTAEGFERPHEHRGVAAVRPAADSGTAQGLRRAQRTPRRVGNQRRRDIADRSRYPLRGRPRDRPHLALQPPFEGQRLPIEPISQASAAQRAGRCGRVAPVCASACTPKRITRLGRASPSPRFCGRTWPRCCCRWLRWSWATWRSSRSWTPGPAQCPRWCAAAAGTRRVRPARRDHRPRATPGASARRPQAGADDPGRRTRGVCA